MESELLANVLIAVSAVLFVGLVLLMWFSNSRQDKAFRDTAEKLYMSLPIDAHRETITRALENADKAGDTVVEILSAYNRDVGALVQRVDGLIDLLLEVTDGEPNDEYVDDFVGEDDAAPTR